MFPEEKSFVQPGNRTFPKHQTLHYLVGYQHEAGKEPILCAEEPDTTDVLIKATHSALPAATAVAATTRSSRAHAYAASKLPKWVQQDRKVLRFFGYFQEHVTDTPSENSRIRRVVFLYYLEDDTLQVSEPKQDNSGLPQVCPFM
jgi:EF-hand domain-containing protein 1